MTIGYHRDGRSIFTPAQRRVMTALVAIEIFVQERQNRLSSQI